MKTKFKSKMWILFIMVIVYPYTCVFADIDNFSLEWIKGKTLDNSFVQTQTIGKTEALIKWKVQENGTYDLEYNITDNEKIVAEVEKKNTEIVFKYFVKTDDEITPLTDYDKDITKTSVIENDYEEWSDDDQIYKAPTTLPEDITKTIKIEDSFRGDIFRDLNQDVKLYWDYANKEIYFVTTGLREGRVHTFNLFYEGELKKNIQILKNWDFQVQPTYLTRENGNLVNRQYVELSSNSLEKPGSLPGLRLNLKRPYIYSEINRKFEPISDDEASKIKVTFNLGKKETSTDTTKSTLQFNMNLSGDPAVYSTSQIGEYTYDNENYTIDIVKNNVDIDGNVLDSKFITWSQLDQSTIYDPIEIIAQNIAGGNYIFDASYSPTVGTSYGYTYLSYDILRKTVDDTYLVITPYKGQGIYTIYQNNSKIIDINSDALKKWVTHLDDRGDEKIYIPLNISRSEVGNQYYTFKVEFKFQEESTPIYSQLAIYDANEDKDINPPVPEFEKIENVILIPSEDKTEPQSVKFTAEWKKPTNISELLKDENQLLWYELCINATPSNYINSADTSKNQTYQILKTIKVMKQGQDIIMISNDGNQKISGATDSFFTMDFSLKNTNGWQQPLKPDWVGLSDDLYSPVSGNVGEYVYASEYNNDFFNAAVKKVPNIYFLTMRALYDKDKNDIQNVLTVSDYAVPTSISLDMSEETIPIPEPSITDLNTDSFKLSWDSINLERYKTNWLDPIGVELENTEYEVFLSQSADSLRQLIENDLLKENKSIDDQNISNMMYIKNDNTQQDSTFKLQLSEDLKSQLRSKKVVVYEVPKEAISIQNVSSNETYYMMLRTRLCLKDRDDEYSKVSELLTTTIKIDPQNPTYSEKTPPSPINLKEEEDSEFKKIKWQTPMVTSESDETIGFEIIRITSTPMTDAHLKASMTVSDLVNSNTYSNMVIWKIQNEKLFSFNTTSKVLEDDSLNILTLDQDGTVHFRDKSITPNTLYYYYVRTTRVKDNDTKAFSYWNYVSITTDPLQRPLNLAIDRESTYSWDKYTEVIVKFDSSVVDKSAATSYEHVFAIKSTDDTDYVETNTSSKYTYTLLTTADSTINSYKNYTYKITGLKSGMNYSIKVKIIDKTKGKLTDGSYPGSVFSDKVEFRTNFNKEDYEKATKYNEYLEFYKKKVQELNKNKYFTADSQTDTRYIKYRAKAMLESIQYVKNNYYTLDNFNTTPNTSYTSLYALPSGMINELKDKKVNLKLKERNITVTIPYTLFDETKNNEIKQVLDKIKQNETTDYYVNLSINISDDFNQSSTKTINIGLSLVELDKNEKYIEENILSEFDTLVKDNQEDFIVDLNAQLDSEINTTKLNEIVETKLTELKEKQYSKVKAILDDYKKSTTDLSSLQVPINIFVSSIQTPVKITINSLDVSGNYLLNQAYVDCYAVGEYNFIPQALEISQVDDLRNSDKIKQLIQKYNLFDGNSPDVNQEVTRKGILIVMSKILQENDTIDYLQYAKEKGLQNVTSENIDYSMKKDEAIYMLMKLYEIQNNTPVETIKIKNYSLLNNITNVEQNYKKSVVAAIEIGIINAQNFNGNESVNTGELLEWLGEM